MDYDWKKIEEDIRQHREELIDRLVVFSLNDVLLFWSSDEKLKQEQEKKWAPIIHWVDETVNARFKTTSGLETPSVNAETTLELKKYINGMSDKELAAFYVAALNMRSVLLALALIKGRINAKQAFELSELEELYHVDQKSIEKEIKENYIKEKTINNKEKRKLKYVQTGIVKSI